MSCKPLALVLGSFNRELNLYEWKGIKGMNNATLSCTANHKIQQENKTNTRKIQGKTPSDFQR